MSWNLINRPKWQAQDLGAPLPDSPHATSVTMPQWRDVTGYEEGDPRVKSQLALGYPRFVIHPSVRSLVHRHLKQGSGLPFPSLAVARRAAAFVRKQSGCVCEIEQIAADQIFLVHCHEAGAAALKAFWQHCGEIVSSRQAQVALHGGHRQLEAGLQAKAEVKQRLAELAGCQADQVWLFPTGMAAIACAQRVIAKRCPHGSTAQFGFPYVDTWKLQQKFGPRAVFFHGTGNELDQIRALAAQDLAAVFTEVPTNPLLHTPPVDALYELLTKAGVPLVLDNTLDTFQNLDVLAHCDLLVTSLTKYFSGKGDVMGGALIINRQSPLADDLHHALLETYEDLLWEGDALALAHNSRDLAARLQRVEHNALSMQRTLRAHPAVARIYAPDPASDPVWQRLRKPGCDGAGGVFSVTLRGGMKQAGAFYDALPLTKGPSLGTNFSLVCPYTLLAHYHELDWAASCGVPAHLIRISAGLEEPELTCARLYQSLSQLAQPECEPKAKPLAVESMRFALAKLQSQQGSSQVMSQIA